MTAGDDRRDELDAADAAAPGWGELLDYLHAARGFDFRGYKPASLMRRVQHRMQALGIDDFVAYRDHLEVHPDEFPALFDAILINVTGFFRDASIWEAVAGEVIPRLLEAKPDHEPIRVWSAGCSTGEEAYTIAILLTEALGPEQYRSRVKIYATDMDEQALAVARAGVYSDRQMEGLAPDLRDRYFDATPAGWSFRRDLRKQLIFGRHNLLQDAPISRIDLLVCRNVLMYFNAETQAQILGRFHFALNPGGFLVLGRAETLMAHAEAFRTVDLRRRISMKIMRAAETRPRPALPARDADGDPPGLRDLALETAPLATLVLDAEGRLMAANERARTMFGISPDDVGRPLQDMRISYRPVELRSLVEQAQAERRPVTLKGVEWPGPPGGARWVDVQVSVFHGAHDEPVGGVITIADVTVFRRLQTEVEHARQELETAYQELQSINEELETTNEELQSTIEELETTNEELQSTNEELEAMNDELRQRTDDLDEANHFLEAVLGSLTAAVAVVDLDARVLRWNRHAEDLWGLRTDEVVRRPLLNLDIGLPVDHLRQPLRAAFAGETPRPVRVPAVNRRGRQVTCEVRCLPLTYDGDPAGAIVMMDAHPIDGVTAGP